MTKVYFVRHAKPDFSVHEDLIRPLTEEGLRDSKKVTEFLFDKDISRIYASPYKRAMDTVRDLADKLNLDIITKDDLRERAVSDGWIEDFKSFFRAQWEDFSYKLPKGECLKEVQERNVQALKEILKENCGDNVVVGTHGTALSTIIHYYDNKFGLDEFNRIIDIMPWVVVMEFQGEELVSVEEVEL
ncbi:MAG: histidine phosphatase family protein [Clostridium sp.]|uniref:histidine phosphatase family protein n=1 Tax=Clostridium sp. TaxID=1506 RepID=UPI0030419712